MLITILGEIIEGHEYNYKRVDCFYMETIPQETLLWLRFFYEAI